MPIVHIGTSGFSYPSWRDSFYPKELPSSQWLRYYSSVFNSLELNYTFYRFPAVKPLQTIYHSTPDDFVFSVKAHKIITHTLRMNKAKAKILEFTGIVEQGLNHKMGCILFQMPPSFIYSEENMDRIIENVPGFPHHVVEFRHDSWWNNKAVDALRKHKLTFCNVSFPRLPEYFYKTTSIIYVRMHGVPKLFESSYSDKKLKDMIKKIPPAAKELFIYFNNTSLKAGFSNALSLQQMMLK